MVYVETKNEVRATQIDKIFHQKKQLGNVTIIANYIAPNAKELLIEQGINYIDKAGNISFKHNSIHVHVEGKLNQSETQTYSSKAFTKTGTKVLFQFLNQPELLNKPYREIARSSDVALGTIPNVMAALKAENYLTSNDQDRLELAKVEELVQHWCEAYLTNLKPLLYRQSFSSTSETFNQDWSNLTELEETVFGGECALAMDDTTIKPSTFTIYSNQKQNAVNSYFQLTPDKLGKIHVYDKFWKENTESKITSQLLMYADLMDKTQGKFIEKANLILKDIVTDIEESTNPSKIKQYNSNGKLGNFDTFFG